MKNLRRATIAAVSITVVAASTSFAQDAIPLSRTNRTILQPEMEVQVQPGGFNKADHLSGDWWGYRDRWQNEGVEVFGFYNSIFSGNVRGGIHPRHATYVDDAWLGFKFNLEKLVGWRGGLFVVSGINRNGDDLTTKYIGSIFSTQQSVGGQRPFLYQVFLEQKLLEGRLRAKLGRFSASDDFNGSPLYGYSVNNGIDGDIRNVLFDTRFSAYPFAVWAAALLYDPTPEFNAKFGLFQTSSRMFENDDNGLNWGIEGRDGYTAIIQIGWSPQFFMSPVSSAPTGKESSAPVMKGLPGHYWIGFTYSDWEGYRRFAGGFEDRSYGFYVHGDQMIYQEAPGSDQGLTAFVASGYYPQSEIAIVPFQVNLGLNYKGLFPGRDRDHTMLHFIYGDLSRDYARSLRKPGGHLAEAEKVIEVAHRFQLTPWSYFQPDIQYVIDPGGTGDIPNALVIGAQMGFTF
ncbi:MAG: carbohydrate porin [Chthoniobacterales bacterium]|nr:MAG: carbohydrate porin [Chthoniobacterales bacterium]